MGVPLNQALRVGAYVVKQHLLGRRRYPLVLMLEPLFRCNLACAGCGKIDYPDAILNQRLSVAECLQAVEECGAPVVAIAGGEPLLHKEMPQIVEAILARGKFVYLCTNALLLEKKLDQYKPHRNFAWDVHLDGDEQMHDHSVSQRGVYARAIAAIRAAKARGFRVCINTTLFDGADPESGARPRNCSAKSSDAARDAAGSSTSRRCSSISWPATSAISARPGASRRATCSVGSGPATCSARAMPRPTRS